MSYYNNSAVASPGLTRAQMDANTGITLTAFVGLQPPQTIDLDRYGMDAITFGREQGRNTICLPSPVVSAEHGCFQRVNGQWYIRDKGDYMQKGSTNGLTYNNTRIKNKALNDGDFIRIDDGVKTVAEGVLFIVSSKAKESQWQMLELGGRREIKIGRAQGCDIQLPHISVMNCHARIVWGGDGYYLINNDTTNGIVVNDRWVSGKMLLNEKDIIVIQNSKLIFTKYAIYFCCYQSGVSVDTTGVVIVRSKGKKSFVTSNDVYLSIKPGELVSIVGGSGAGKSTILNCMCGYLPPTKGAVYINGVNLYQNLDSIKSMIGYVPQADIVYDNLTLYDMLLYTAKLRLPQDASRQEIEGAITRAIATVQLTEKRDAYIKNLSGGQKKRASIAVELLSNPNLLFLDEPCSGLDPGTERDLMVYLRDMAHKEGKTVILVTHSTLQLKMCDKIVFMGAGGNLCYFGSYDEALRFFQVSDVVDIYKALNEKSLDWRNYYYSKLQPPAVAQSSGAMTGKTRKKFQLPVLSARYLKLVGNDRQRLLLLLIQAPLLALLISLVADGQQFEQYEMTKSLLFALSCSAFWVGMLNAIQEICKERNILKREFMAGLSLNAYVLSKILVLGCVCLVQSVMIVSVFTVAVGTPEEGLILPPFLELLITTFLTALASTAMGLFVSSLFKNADRAMTVAPILLMPQILFSGLIFKLDGATETISWFAVCRWCMEGFGTTANLNDLTMRLQQQYPEFPFEHAAEDFFEYTVGHLAASWAILAVFVVAFLVLARVVLSRIGKETA